MTILRLYFVY